MLEVGVRLPNAGPKATAENITVVARLAEQLGYHSLWVTDRVLVPHAVGSHYPYGAGGRWTPAGGANIDPLLTLAWAAAAAPSAKLGASVLVAPLRHPVLLAKQLASLDYLSGGRALAGLGAGWMEEEFVQLGVPFRDRGRRTEEMVAIMRALWTGDAVNFEGRYWNVKGVQLLPGPVRGGIPVLWGGHSDAVLARVARVGDGWHPTRITLDELADGMRRLRERCERAGRDPSSVPVVVRPGATYAVTADTHARHLELGVSHLIIDTPVDDPSMSRVLDEMHHVAEVCGLRPKV
jgi:probable F420-dependent oxidoreductase